MSNNRFDVLIFKDKKHFIATTVSVDVAAQGSTADEALGRLTNLVTLEIKEAADKNMSLVELVGPAPVFVQELFNNKSTPNVEKTLIAA